MPSEVSSKLNDHSHSLVDGAELVTHNIFCVSWLPDFIIKRSTHDNRVEGARRFAEAIKQLGMQHIFYVPKKYAYQCPSGHEYVICEMLKNSQDAITLPDVKNIIKLAMVIGWQDSHRDNFFKLPNGLIAIIDTELTAIVPSGKDLKHKIIKRMFCESGYTPDAKDYLYRHLHSTPPRKIVTKQH
ncbi:hypothetical protein Noda2021_01680 [Candidatus Dependentiae bacterium Noda2021]|nr:hypothetical protein Noda2021_01680 [Candidatus Dependentiae bacterium Noda2021]